jgi:signal transduction histidine kinase
MGSFNQNLAMATMATDSLRRIAGLSLKSLGASTLAVYLRSDSDMYHRVLALPDYPEQVEQEGDCSEQTLVKLLASDRINVVEATCEHPKLADHPWVSSTPGGWTCAASAPLTPLSSTTPIGCLIIANQQSQPFDKAAREHLGDLAALIIERLELQRSKAEVAGEMDRVITTGILAAGVAHEINNPLSFVCGNIQFALRLLDEGVAESDKPESIAELKEALTDALVGSRRVHNVVQDLHRLAGGSANDDFSIESIDLIEPLKSSLNIARKHIEQRAQLVTELNKVAEVMGNQSKLGQIFLNLLINAAQAIPKGQVGDNEVRVSTANRGSDVVVSISDTGTGISKENLAHIFAPYFTTKSQTEGTGLGLAISHNIVTAMSGDIEIDTELGQGTTFRIVLPSAAKATREVPSI